MEYLMEGTTPQTHYNAGGLVRSEEKKEIASWAARRNIYAGDGGWWGDSRVGGTDSAGELRRREGF